MRRKRLFIGFIASILFFAMLLPFAYSQLLRIVDEVKHVSIHKLNNDNVTTSSGEEPLWKNPSAGGASSGEEPLWGEGGTSFAPEDRKFPLAIDEEKAVEDALSSLPKGDLYYVVPLTMKVQKQSVVEAGITPIISQRILRELKNKSNVHIKNGVQYSTSGVEMKLITRKEDFDVLSLHIQEKQRILKTSPGKWKWLVTPLKSGEKLVTVQAIVYLKTPTNKEKESFPYEVFSKEITIKSDPAYSFNQFFAANWDKVIGLVFGSGTLGGVVTWWIGQRKGKVKNQAEAQEKEAVVGRK